MRALGLAALAFWSLVLVVAASSSTSDRVIPVLVGGGLGIPSTYLFLETSFARIEFDSACIYTHSPWRRDREIPWADIVEWNHSEIHHSYLILTRNHGVLRVSRYMSGVGSFVAKLNTISKSSG